MDSMQIEVVRRNVRLGEVQYELTAIRDEGGDYRATWRCPNCNVGGASSLAYPRPVAALDWAQRCAAVHEGQRHGKSSPAKR